MTLKQYKDFILENFTEKVAYGSAAYEANITDLLRSIIVPGLTEEEDRDALGLTMASIAGSIALKARHKFGEKSGFELLEKLHNVLDVCYSMDITDVEKIEKKQKEKEKHSSS